MNKKFKQISKILIILIFIFCMFNFNNLVFAIEEEIKPETLEYSINYLEWLELTEEEKKNTIEPNLYNFRGELEDTFINNFFKYADILKETFIPASYSILNDYYQDATLEVKNQQDTGLCWGFVANTALETTIKKKQNQVYNFSERHMEYATTNINGLEQDKPNRELNSGGNSRIALSYWTSGKGPILETAMPFQNNWDSIDIQDMPTINLNKKIENFEYFPNIYKNHYLTPRKYNISRC